MPTGQLGRQVPKDWKHVERYPLTALGDEAPTGIPGVFGIGWFTGDDAPQKDSAGRWWIGRGPRGAYRGGHAIAAKSRQPDAESWHGWYDQNPYGGACVGFSLSRMMSLYNRVRYQGEWLYYEAQKVDYWPGGDYPGASPNYQGTAISSACDILRTVGHKMKTWGSPRASAGIITNRWISGSGAIDEIHRTLGLPLADKLGAIPLLQSWGTFYPRIVWMPDAEMAYRMEQDGEFVVVTDR